MSSKKLKILASTGIRSEYDILYPVISELGSRGHEIKLILSGAHLSDWHGSSLKKIENDGFKISDEDLKLRGPGEFLGTKQHGYISSKLLDVISDGEIIRHARTRAFEIIENDPKLISNQNLKNKLLKDYKHMLEFVNIG